MHPSFVAGKRIRTFGGWYRHDDVIVDGVRLAGFIQVRRRNGRIKTTTHFQPLSCAVIGSDWQWLYRMHQGNNAVAVASGFQTIERES